MKIAIMILDESPKSAQPILLNRICDLDLRTVKDVVQGIDDILTCWEETGDQIVIDGGTINVPVEPTTI